MRADQGVPYGRVAEVIGVVQKAGLSRIGFVTDCCQVARRPSRVNSRSGTVSPLSVADPVWRAIGFGE